MRRLQALKQLGRVVNRRRFGPRPLLIDARPVVRLGTQYGGWSLLARESLRESVVVSCGVGEDVSFDIELMTQYGVQVWFVDPTPRALAHLQGLQERLGASAEGPFSSGGKQPLDSYDLSRIKSWQFKVVPAAVSDMTGTARFFAPPTSEGVSYSLTNFQNSYDGDTPWIEVQVVSLAELLDEIQSEISILKMDIEGAEVEAISALAKSPHRPHQILVEYDELSRPSAHSRERFELGHNRLLREGYRPFHFDGRTCVSYVHVKQQQG